MLLMRRELCQAYSQNSRNEFQKEAEKQETKTTEEEPCHPDSAAAPGNEGEQQRHEPQQ